MHYIVAIPYDVGLAESIGRKGSENGITFFNRKEEGNTIVCLVPTNPDDKFYTVAESIMLAEQVVLSTKEIDSVFGEVLVAAAMLNKRIIFTDENDVSALAKGLNFEVSERDMVIESIIRYKGRGPAESEGKTVVLIDRVFPVKGVGTVALGFVTNGTVHVHDTLYHNSGKKVFIRSIQLQDEDVVEAGVGSRVGLALKNIEYDEADKGDVLSSEEVSSVEELSAKLETTKIEEEEIRQGNRYELVSNFISVSAEVLKWDETTKIVSLGLAKKVPIGKGGTFVLIRSRMPRIFAKGESL
ncbi:MAG: EF-Tu/IF-2/RF-3 family GTPase [Candidatus Micrarchaeaceae archaeon]